MARISGWEGTGGIEDTTPPEVHITKPVSGIYFNNKLLFNSATTLIILDIDIEVDAFDDQSGIDRIEFYIDDVIKDTTSYPPYSLLWNERSFKRHTIKVIAFDKAGNSASDELSVIKIL